MDDIEVLKAELEDPKNAFAISKLEDQMRSYVVAKRSNILEYHQKVYGSRNDESSYEHAIIQYFVFEDRCCLDNETETKIQLGRAARSIVAKLKRNIDIDLDGFVTAFLKEQSIAKASASFAEHAADITRFLAENGEEWREDYMVTVALLFDVKSSEYVQLLLSQERS